MSVNPSTEQLDKAAQGHLRAAAQALDTPCTAAYLAHVSTECALKLRLLRQYRKPRTDAMEVALGKNLFEKLFRSATGHNLAVLAQHGSLKRLLETEKKQHILARTAWQRMQEAERPYSLRYGTERLAREHADEELAFAREVVELATKP